MNWGARGNFVEAPYSIFPALKGTIGFRRLTEGDAAGNLTTDDAESFYENIIS